MLPKKRDQKNPFIHFYKSVSEWAELMLAYRKGTVHRMWYKYRNRGVRREDFQRCVSLIAQLYGIRREAN